MGLEWDLGRVSYFFFNSSDVLVCSQVWEMVTSSVLLSVFKFFLNTFEKLKKVINTFPREKNFAYNVRDSEYPPSEGHPRPPIKNLVST